MRGTFRGSFACVICDPPAKSANPDSEPNLSENRRFGVCVKVMCGKGCLAYAHGDWPALVREITGGGAPRAVNAARGQAAIMLKAVADGGRLATITGDPPQEERGVAVSDVYVRPDGGQLSALAELLARRTLSVPIASVRPFEQAAQALREVVAGADGAIVLSLRT